MRYCIVLSNESILKINKWKFNASMLHIKCRNYRVLISRTLIKISWKQNWCMLIDFTKYFTNVKTISTQSGKNEKFTFTQEKFRQINSLVQGVRVPFLTFWELIYEKLSTSDHRLVKPRCVRRLYILFAKSDFLQISLTKETFSAKFFSLPLWSCGKTLYW